MGRVRAFAAGAVRVLASGEHASNGRPRARAAIVAAVVVFALGCGGEKSSPATNAGYGLVLNASGGVYDDGSGLLGVAVLTTLRDASGAGPATPWNIALRNDAGALPVSAAYAPGPPGSYEAWWWPAIPPQAGEYALFSSDGARSLETNFSVASQSGLARPDVSVSVDASALSWPTIPWAAAYECRIYAAGALQYVATASTASCDVSTLPARAYEASVLAFSADLPALAASGAQQPPVPSRFDVSETRLAFVRPGLGAPALKVTAAGGALRYGTTQPGLAIWMSVAQADGQPTDAAWTVAVTGPGLPPDAPLTFTYAAGLTKTLLWSYDVPATQGTYALTAVSSAGAVAASFTVGQPTALDAPLDVAATADTGGGASVNWTPVAGARSYYVGVWTQATAGGASTFQRGQWVSGPPAAFPSGAFSAGAAYEVYVAATDVEMVAPSSPPAQVAVSENTFFPASFVAR